MNSSAYSEDLAGSLSPPVIPPRKTSVSQASTTSFVTAPSTPPSGSSPSLASSCSAYSTSSTERGPATPRSTDLLLRPTSLDMHPFASPQAPPSPPASPPSTSSSMLGGGSLPPCLLPLRTSSLALHLEAYGDEATFNDAGVSDSDDNIFMEARLLCPPPAQNIKTTATARCDHRPQLAHSCLSKPKFPPSGFTIDTCAFQMPDSPPLSPKTAANGFFPSMSPRSTFGKAPTPINTLSSWSFTSPHRATNTVPSIKESSQPAAPSRTQYQRRRETLPLVSLSPLRGSDPIHPLSVVAPGPPSPHPSFPRSLSVSDASTTIGDLATYFPRRTVRRRSAYLRVVGSVPKVS